MRTIKASEFKARCLQLIDEVAATGEPIAITKRGKVMVEMRVAEAAAAEDKWVVFQKLFPASAQTDNNSELDPSFSIWDELGGLDAHMERKFGDLWKGNKDAAE